MVLVVIMLWYFINFNDPQWYLAQFESAHGYKARKKNKKRKQAYDEHSLVGALRTLNYLDPWEMAHY